MKAAEKSHIILIGATRLTPDFLKKTNGSQWQWKAIFKAFKSLKGK